MYTNWYLGFLVLSAGSAFAISAIARNQMHVNHAVLIAGISWAIGLALILPDAHLAISRLRRGLEYHRTHHQRVAGHDATIGAYELYSFDKGSSWIAVNSNGQLLGPADQVWSDRLEQLIANGERFTYRPKGWLARLIKPIAMLEEYKWWENAYDHKQGGGILGGVDWYTLCSYDQGRHWVALDRDRRVLGEAGKVYPGLIERITALDELARHCQENGPINAGDSRGITLLERSGFTVEKKP